VATVWQQCDSAGAELRGSKGRADVEGEAEARQDQEPRAKNISKINESLEHKVFENMIGARMALRASRRGRGEVNVIFAFFGSAARSSATSAEHLSFPWIT
jgi:hypothetical protein